MDDAAAKKLKHVFIVIFWLCAALASMLALQHLGKPFKIGEISDPKAESTIAQHLIEKEFKNTGGKVFVLYTSHKYSVYKNTFRAEVQKSLDGLKQLPFKYTIASPYENERQVSKDEHAAYAVIKTEMSSQILANHVPAIKSALGTPERLHMYIGGKPVYTADVYALSERNLVRAEMVALPISFVVMIFVFGGILPALITILSGVISITIIMFILYVLGHQFDLAIFVLNIASTLGLGLTLDYSLLLTYRFREEYRRCGSCTPAIHRTLRSAGTAIFFSGIIVLISIASLVVFPLNMLFSVGVGGIVVVIVTVAVSLTFLPSMLCLLEKSITKTMPSLEKISTEDVNDHFWYRFAVRTMRHPILISISMIIILVLLGSPFIDVKLNSSDARILPTWASSRQLMDHFDDHFNANTMSPIQIVFSSKTKITNKKNIGELYDFAKKLEKDPRVDHIESIVTLKSGMDKADYQRLYQAKELPLDEQQKKLFKDLTKRNYTLMSITSNYPQQDSRNFALVEELRKQQIDHGITQQVTGNSAKIIDTIHTAYSLFIKVMIVISIVTYITLLILLRSVILPIKAIFMNLLSLSVCYGMLVYIFQEGHFHHLLHFKPVGYTDLALPILIFFAIFGISMDYEVFLLARIKEFYDKNGNNKKSVAYGLERSARIITSAALIMVIVSGSLVIADIVFIKAFGLGMALTILIDATLIRLLLVPATMRLFGDWNWYLPKWLDRILPRVKFD